MEWLYACLPWCRSRAHDPERSETDPLLPQFPPPNTILTPPRPHSHLPSPVYTGNLGPWDGSSPASAPAPSTGTGTGRPGFPRAATSPEAARVAQERRARWEAVERDFSGRMRGRGLFFTQPLTPTTADTFRPPSPSSPSSSTHPDRPSAPRLIPQSISDLDTRHTDRFTRTDRAGAGFGDSLGFLTHQRTASSPSVAVPPGRGESRGGDSSAGAGRQRSASVYCGFMSPIASVGVEGEEGMAGRLGRSRSAGGLTGLDHLEDTRKAEGDRGREGREGGREGEEEVTRISLGLRGLGSVRRGQGRRSRSRGRGGSKGPRAVSN